MCNQCIIKMTLCNLQFHRLIIIMHFMLYIGLLLLQPTSNLILVNFEFYFGSKP